MCTVTKNSAIGELRFYILFMMRPDLLLRTKKVEFRLIKPRRKQKLCRLHIPEELPPILDYGVPGRGIEDQAKFVMELPFNQYMDSFPDEKDGLWGDVREVLGTDINIPSLREKYKDTKRVLVRHE